MTKRSTQPSCVPNVSSMSWNDYAVGYERILSRSKLHALAEELGVSPTALSEVEVGFDSVTSAYTFPERNASLQVIGIATRAKHGHKRFLAGGHRGLTIPKLLKLDDGAIFIVEGPTDVAAMLTMGLPAVGRPSNHGGVDHLTELFINREIIIVGENDKKPNGDWPGRTGAMHVAELVAAASGTPVKWTLPPVGHKDVRAWLRNQRLNLNSTEQCRSAGQVLRTKLLAEVQAVEPATCRSAPPYFEKVSGLYFEKTHRNGDTLLQRLTNFTARITKAVRRDDGAEIEQLFTITVRLHGRTLQTTITSAAFQSMDWPLCEIGPEAIVYPGQLVREHIRVAMQLLSTSIEQTTVYTHSGWRTVDHRWVYLHGNGAITEDGLRNNVATELPDALSSVVLPAPLSGQELKEAITRWMKLLGLGPDHITFPLFAAVWRSVLGTSDFTVHLSGKTGVFKSELAALGQQHFGREFDARHLLASWSSTANYLEILTHSAKDMLLVVDDFAPSGSSADVQRLHSVAERLIRAQGNRACRGRLTAGSKLRPGRPPRGMILSTGEDVPKGHSILARLVVIEIGEDDIDAAQLAEVQQLARDGLFVAVASSFIQWLAPRMPSMATQIQDAKHRAREGERPVGHRRTPDLLCELSFGFRKFLEFCRDVVAIDEDQVTQLTSRLNRSIVTLQRQQQVSIADSDQVDRFLELLTSAFAAGDAHLQPLGEWPFDGCAEAVGWHVNANSRERHPQGSTIGWIDSKANIFLVPMAAYRAVQHFGGASNMAISVGERTLWRRLHERGLLIQFEGSDRHTIKKTIGSIRRRVLCLHASALGLDGSGQSGLTTPDTSQCLPESPDRPDKCPDKDRPNSSPGAENRGVAAPPSPHAPKAPVDALNPHNEVSDSGEPL